PALPHDRVPYADCKPEEDVDDAERDGKGEHRDHCVHPVPADPKDGYRVEPAHRLPEVAEELSEEDPEEDRRYRGDDQDVGQALCKCDGGIPVPDDEGDGEDQDA